jgi:hypothetical protein
MLSAEAAQAAARSATRVVALPMGTNYHCCKTPKGYNNDCDVP